MIPLAKALLAERRLREIKISALNEALPCTAEIILIPHSPDPANIQTQYPGLYVFTDPGRLIRPVTNLVCFY